MDTTKIKVLQKNLIDQIAAGEVVERPASVVKELLENAIDAKAKCIQIEIIKGGLSLIQVTDDGEGMGRVDLEKSVQRHATSKISEIADLLVLRTMGFRGEALPSIGSVSKMQISSRSLTQETAFQIQLEGGNLTDSVQELAMNPGTKVLVQDLFYNVPARLKFMKTTPVEIGHIADTVLHVALAYPNIQFRFKSDGKEVFDLPACMHWLERAQSILEKTAGTSNQSFNQKLWYSSSNEMGVDVKICVGEPTWNVSSAKNIHFLVNSRYIRDRALLNAVTSSYGDLIPKGRYPVCVVSLTLASGEVDVNVHPQKLEVRFQKPQEVYQVVRRAITKLILRAPWLKGEKSSEVSSELALNDSQEKVHLFTPDKMAQDERPSYAYSSISSRESSSSEITHKNKAEYEQKKLLPTELGKIQQPSFSPKRFFSIMEYLGQWQKTYLICGYEKELILIDQHAAHERLAYERLCERDKKNLLPIQQLLIPIHLDLAIKSFTWVQANLQFLRELGFELTLFGSSTYLLKSAPNVAEFGRGAKYYNDPQKMFEKVLQELESERSLESLQKMKQKVWATVACHSVIRAGDVLDQVSARALLNSLDEYELVPYCPHGRPILLRMSQAEIEKLFRRT